jgi:Bacterial Ig-like domain (group 2)
MLRITNLAASVCWTLVAVPAGAANLKLSPAEIVLTGPHASQQLLALTQTAGTVDGDHTAKAKFTSSNPTVAMVDESGNVRAVGDGEALVTAVEGISKATAKVRVTKTKEPFTWSFRNHVIPVLTKIGCNSGACHGALAGKGGFKLSLRGYAAADDHFVLTRQALGRRVNKVEPAQSIMLRKPTLAVSHGGGLKLEVGSPEYQLLADWIASGAPGPRDDDIRIQRLEIFPREAILKPNDFVQVVVRACTSPTSRPTSSWGSTRTRGPNRSS